MLECYYVVSIVFCMFIGVAIVTPPGSTPSHRAGLEPGTPAQEAGRSTKEAKGYSL